MKALKIFLPALLAALLLSGCATLKAWSELEQRRQVDCAGACPGCACPR